MRISEIFYSIQGEGVGIGAPTVFVRLYGCDLRCSWCDTMYAVEGGDFTVMSTDDVFAKIEGYGCNKVCITGGEPLLQAHDAVVLTQKLLDGGYTITLETSGHIAPPDIFSHPFCVVSMDCKCPSSGMVEKMNYDLYKSLGTKDQLKFVIADEDDYSYATAVIKTHDTKAAIIFQPVEGMEIEWLAERTLRDKIRNVRMLPQLHKIIWGNRRGK